MGSVLAEGALTGDFARADGVGARKGVLVAGEDGIADPQAVLATASSSASAITRQGGREAPG